MGNSGSNNSVMRTDPRISSKRFRAKLGSDAGPLFVQVPFDVKKEFGKARAPVKVTLNDYRYRSTISVYGGKYYLPVRKERRTAAGIKTGDFVDVTIRPDREVRKVNPPAVLKAALANNRAAEAEWQKLSYSRRKEYAEAILRAKKTETRTRRIQRILRDLIIM
jgi:Domain of unknown function (DUF1905)/Bacteriocin-protection, YdeI or OmpD-Associated